MTKGYEAGESCNRDGCKGIIEQNETDTSCSCHNHPPCSHCTTSREFCPECNWDGREEQIQSDKANRNSSNDSEYYKKQIEDFDRERKRFYDLYRSTQIVSNLEYRKETHTHFSMKVVGCFPLGMDSREIINEVNGTFGGRFNYLNKATGRFEFIAYTD